MCFVFFVLVSREVFQSTVEAGVKDQNKSYAQFDTLPLFLRHASHIIKVSLDVFFSGLYCKQCSPSPLKPQYALVENVVSFVLLPWFIGNFAGVITVPPTQPTDDTRCCIVMDDGDITLRSLLFCLQTNEGKLLNFL